MPEPSAAKEPEWPPQVLCLAAEEAAASGHSRILPAHLLIALCRVVDLPGNDQSPVMQATQRRLRRELEALSIDPQRFRRRLRALVVKGAAADAAEVLRRELAQYAAKHGRPAGIRNAVAFAESTQAITSRAALLAGTDGDSDGLYLLRALLLGDMELPVAKAPAAPALDDWLREITTNNEIFKKPSKDLLMSILVHLDEEIKHAPGGKERSKLVWLFDRIAPRLEFPEPNSYEVFTEYRLGLPKETE